MTSQLPLLHTGCLAFHPPGPGGCLSSLALGLLLARPHSEQKTAAFGARSPGCPHLLLISRLGWLGVGSGGQRDEEGMAEDGSRRQQQPLLASSRLLGSVLSSCTPTGGALGGWDRPL